MAKKDNSRLGLVPESAASQRKPLGYKSYAPLPTHRNVYDVAEVSAHVGLSARMLVRYCEQKRFDQPGILGAEKIGRPWIIFKRGLEYFMKQSRQVGNPNFGSI